MNHIMMAVHQGGSREGQRLLAAHTTAGCSQGSSAPAPSVHTGASKSSIRRFIITEKALVGAFSVITNLRMELGWNFLKH